LLLDESEKELLDDTQEALGQLREQCSQEYARLKRVERDDIDQEERDQLEHERAEIEAQYERMSNPGAAEYREGSTVTMMMQASRELTARVSSKFIWVSMGYLIDALLQVCMVCHTRYPYSPLVCLDRSSRSGSQCSKLHLCWK